MGIEIEVKEIKELQRSFCILTINRPKALNAFNSAILAELNGALSEIDQNKKIGAIIFTGSGSAFAAGADISEISRFSAQEAQEFCLSAQAVFNKIENMPQVSIAAINGFALGGGLELALACDIRIASRDAYLGQPEVGLGLIPGFGGTQRLPRIVGMGPAKYLILSGLRISARDAESYGLVSGLCETDILLEQATILAKKILRNGPLATSQAKKLIHNSLATPLEQGLEAEARIFASLMPKSGEEDLNEMKEGTRAFLEKRRPDFGKLL